MDLSSSENLENSTNASHYETPHTDNNADASSQPSPEQEDDDEGEGTSKPSLPMQKRRRVTRACDECRKKKIKCDGKQPCTHCQVYSYDCTYDQPSNRRRNPAPQYIEALENRLKRTEALLTRIFPNCDLNDQNLEAVLQSGIFPQPVPREQLGAQAQRHAGVNGIQSQQAAEKPSAPDDGNADSRLESMVRSTGQLDLDEQGFWDYHGHSSGLSFVRRLREQFGDMMGPEGQATPFIKSRPMSTVFDSPRSSGESPLESTMSYPAADLPPKDVARQLVDNVLNDATALLRFVHQPSFHKSFNRLYETTPDNFGNEENTFLPLLYTVMAVGSLFAKDHNRIESKGYESAIDEGFKYFKAARQIMDIADCRNLSSLQAIIFMILFLQSSAKLSTCYSYIGIALRSAVRMGLHRSFNQFNPIEVETRKRVFWVIRKLDTYVGALLGLPHALSEDDIDQEYPIEVDDQYITETGLLPMPEGSLSLISAFNAHTDLVAIVAKIVKHIYPIKGALPSQNKDNAKSYSVSYSKIRELEKDLQNWLDKLPMGLKPGGEAPMVMIRVQQLLRIAYAHAQMMLYRPFLHYVAPKCASKNTDKRAYACASACISVCRNIVHITSEMKRRGLLGGAYWFTPYTTFFAILTLIYFMLENPDNPTSQELLRDANEGRETLAQLAKRSMAADRCTVTLANLFNSLPERLTQQRELLQTSKKRRQATTPTISTTLAAQSSQQQASDPQQNRRAQTFPRPLTTDYSKRSSMPHAMPSQAGQSASYHHSSPQELLSADHDMRPTSSSNMNVSFGGSQQHSPYQASFPMTPTSAAFGNSANLNTELPDITPMMFPTGDPFAYPNQAMTTFESNNPSNRSSALFNTAASAGINHTSPQSTSSMHSSLQQNSPAMETGMGDLDVQLFGPTPMYFMANQNQNQQNPQQQQQSSMSNNNLSTSASFQQANFHPSQTHKQQNSQQGSFANTAAAGMDLGDLFTGDEWANGWFQDPQGFAGWGQGFNNQGVNWPR